MKPLPQTSIQNFRRCPVGDQRKVDNTTCDASLSGSNSSESLACLWRHKVARMNKSATLLCSATKWLYVNGLALFVALQSGPYVCGLTHKA